MSDPAHSDAPLALLLATQPWPVAAKLGLALRDCGFSIGLWAPRSNLLLRAGVATRHYPFRVLGIESSLASAIAQARPALLVPCDELAASTLHRLAAASRGGAVQAALDRSFGPAARLARLTERAYVLQVAAEAGLAVPEHRPVSHPGELRSWLADRGFPAYLKADGTFGAMGVRRVESYAEAETAFAELEAPPGAVDALRRYVLDRDPALIAPSLAQRRGVLSVQRAVPGRDANSAFFCWRGRVLASLTMEVLAVSRERGPSTVLRRIHSPAMERAAEVLADRLSLSGFYGLDFILDEAGTPWLLEMNSRATQIPHLALGAGHDLAAAAYAAVTGARPRPRPAVTDKPLIALFPQEWNRDPRSPLLRTAYHDVPWEVPALVAALAGQRPSPLLKLTRGYWKNRSKGLRLDPPVPSAGTLPIP